MTRRPLPGALSGNLPADSAISGKKPASNRSIFVPDLNYGAAVHADKWIPILPNTDAALQLAIAYMWITEGTYDKEYVKTHTVGFDKFADYVLGKEDGIPKHLRGLPLNAEFLSGLSRLWPGNLPPRRPQLPTSSEVPISGEPSPTNRPGWK